MLSTPPGIFGPAVASEGTVASGQGGAADGVVVVVLTDRRRSGVSFKTSLKRFWGGAVDVGIPPALRLGSSEATHPVLLL